MSSLKTTNILHPSSTTNNIVLASDGTTTIASPSNIIKSGTAVASTSGTSIDFTGFPSWVKRVTVMFSDVSTNGTSDFGIQLGTGSTPTYTTSGYSGGVGNITGSMQITTTYAKILYTASASLLNSGIISIASLGSNKWVISGTIGSTSTYAHVSGFTVTLSAALTAVRIMTGNGTDTFDAGTINVLYEG